MSDFYERSLDSEHHNAEYWKHVFDSISDIVFLLDRDQRICDANHASEMIFKKSKKQLIGQYCYSICHNCDQPPDKCPHVKMMETETAVTDEILVETLDKTCLITASPIFDSDGKLTHTFHIAHDMTDYKQAEQDRERFIEQLQSKTKEIENLLRVISHDLRSPLVNVQGFTKELIQDSGELIQSVDKNIDSSIVPELQVLFSRLQESAQFIETGVRKMDTLLQRLSKLDNIGRQELNYKPIDMNQLVADVLREMKYQIEQTRAEIHTNSLPDCIADQQQINQVFTNLLQNALKYHHPKRNPQIRISSAIEQTGPVYSVQDNGIGIPADHKEKVFEMFHRVNSQPSIDGDGLGLAVVRRILERHNGRIWLESQPDYGTTFYVQLPTSCEEKP